MTKFNLEAYKKSIQAAETPLKPNMYVELNSALQAVLGLPGLPLGHISQIYGMSDGGKSSLAFHAAAQAQKQGIMPVFIITEGKVDWNRAAAMGLNKEEAITMDATYLEDVFDAGSGILPTDVMIFVDSIGNTLSRASVTTNKDGTSEIGGAMMKSAKVIRENMRVFTHKINDTRKVSYPFFVGLTFINHAYKSPPAFPGGPTTEVPYGGDAIWFSSSLVIKTKKIQKLKATVNKEQKIFGIVSKLQVDKNHLSNTSNMSEFVVVAGDIIPNDPEAIKDY